MTLGERQKIMKKKTRYTPLQIIMHIYAWSALAHITFDYFAGNLSVNPIQDIEQRTGRAAVTLLVLSLMCTPFNTLFGWKELLKRRRALGLYTFMYASVHVLIFLYLDYGLSWSLIIQSVIEKPYIIFGTITFLLLTPLAITSFDIWKKRLRKNWKRLHQTVYMIAPLAVLHFALSKKGDIFQLQGDVVRPLIYGLVVLILLILRIPRIRKFFASLRTQHLLPFFRRIQTRKPANTVGAD
jgi:sulfoxide reductase heme-binding subunit YedZ